MQNNSNFWSRIAKVGLVGAMRAHQLYSSFFLEARDFISVPVINERASVLDGYSPIGATCL